MFFPEPEQADDPYPLSLSLGNWERLQHKFPGHIDALLLKDMYENFDMIGAYQDNINTIIPESLCHGDYHPENILKDGDKLIICDWQNVGTGKGINDVAFFISRGADMGLKINRDKLIEWYSEALLKYADIKVDVNDFYGSIAAFEFGISFQFWAGYLQDSSIERVLNIYNPMVSSYNLLRNNI